MRSDHAAARRAVNRARVVDSTHGAPGGFRRQFRQRVAKHWRPIHLRSGKLVGARKRFQNGERLAQRGAGTVLSL
jgi:hypothetical protein